jgi:putative thiamine transport system permease protein
MRFAPAHAPAALLVGLSLAPVIAGLGWTIGLAATPGALGDLLSVPGLFRSIALTVWTGLASTALALALAHAMLRAFACGKKPGVLSAIIAPLLAAPHLAMAVGFALLIAPSGLIVRLFSPWATGFETPPDWAIVQDPFGLSLIAGLALKETPFVLFALIAASQTLSPAREVAAARTLGRGAHQAFDSIVAPRLARLIRMPTIAVLAYGIGNVEMALPLAPTAPPPLAVLVWRDALDPDPAMQARAAVGALTLLIVTVLCACALVAGQALLRRLRRGAIWRGAATGEAFLRGAGQAASLIILALSLGSALVLLLRSAAGPWRFPQIIPARWDFSPWADFAIAPGPILTTAALALVVAIACVALTLAALEALASSAKAPGHTNAQRMIALLLFAPLALPQLAVLPGVQAALIRTGIDGAIFAVVWSHFLFAAPYVWAQLAAARARIDPRRLAAARVLGASPLRTWARVTAPLLTAPVCAALSLAIAVSVALYLPTAFAGAGTIATLATETVGAVASGDQRRAAASGAVQALLPLIALALALAVPAALFVDRRGMRA